LYNKSIYFTVLIKTSEQVPLARKAKEMGMYMEETPHFLRPVQPYLLSPKELQRTQEDQVITHS